jgi:hypothetical protein
MTQLIPPVVELNLEVPEIVKLPCHLNLAVLLHHVVQLAYVSCTNTDSLLQNVAVSVTILIASLNN